MASFVRGGGAAGGRPRPDCSSAPCSWRTVSPRKGGAIRRQPVGRDFRGSKALLLEQLTHELPGRRLVPRRWTRTSSTSTSSWTARHRYIRRPAIRTTISSRCQRGLGLHRSRRRRRATAGPNFRTRRRIVSFVGDVEPALGQQVFPVAVAQREPEIKPDCLLDDRGRELVAGVGDRRHPSRLSTRPADRHRSRDNAEPTSPTPFSIASCTTPSASSSSPPRATRQPR